MRLPNFFRGIAFVAAAASFSLVLSCAILAWSEPGQTPPGGNVAAPINTGGTAQTKLGDLKIGTGLKISSDGTAFALKTDAGVDQFSVDQEGNAVALSKLTSEDKICFGSTNCRAKWVAGTCDGAGNYMKGIDANGNVICSGTSSSCTHKVCAADDCGPFADGDCGGTINCPACTSPKVCNASGKCVCTPNCSGKNCGQDNDCGSPCQTGACQTGSCSAGKCVVATKNCGGCSVGCSASGYEEDLCGNTIWCGVCAPSCKSTSCSCGTCQVWGTDNCGDVCYCGYDNYSSCQTVSNHGE